MAHFFFHLQPFSLMSTYLLGILRLGVLEESLLVQGAGVLSPGVGAFHTAFEKVQFVVGFSLLLHLKSLLMINPMCFHLSAAAYESCA